MTIRTIIIAALLASAGAAHSEDANSDNWTLTLISPSGEMAKVSSISASACGELAKLNTFSKEHETPNQSVTCSYEIKGKTK